jgi:hypothetical protein
MLTNASPDAKFDSEKGRDLGRLPLKRKVMNEGWPITSKCGRRRLFVSMTKSSCTHFEILRQGGV